MSHNGKPWTGPDQFEDSTGQLMMLPTDIMLVAEPEFKKWVELYAKDEVCLRFCFRILCRECSLLYLPFQLIAFDILTVPSHFPFTQDKFFQDFAAAFAKLLSLGAPAAAVVAKPWYQFW